MRRLPVAAFVTLAALTVGAFFVTQHLKISTPLINGRPSPHPSAINPVNGQTCGGLSHRSMFVSFYLQNRSDDVDVYMVDSGGDIVATLASGVHMQGGRHPVRRRFDWNGHTSSGAVAADGIYYIRVALHHEGRSVLIADPAGGPLPVTVETTSPHPRVISVRPALIPRGGFSGATVSYTGNRGLPGRMLIYRTDLPGAPTLVKSFAARRGASSTWDGTVSHGVPAAQGTYLVGLRVTDQACNTGSFPPVNPPVPGTTANAGVTVRYLAALPPLTPVASGATATVFVDARQHGYAWALRRTGGDRVIAAGRSRAVALHVPIPASASSAGLYQLALRYGAHRTLLPLVGTGTGNGSTGVLVVLPSLTWQGANPVDDDGDGIPNTLTAGYPVLLSRPLVNGLPAGWKQDVALLRYLQRNRLRYDLTTDLGLTFGAGPKLTGHAAVVLAGDERWVPPALSGALRSYVSKGGHVLSLGIDSLRRGVTLSGARASHPTAPQGADIFGARVGAITSTRGAFILAGRDRLGLFAGTSGAFRAFPSYQAIAGVMPPLSVASAAGTTSTSSAIIGYRLGRGLVVEVGIPGFAARLARSADAQEILSRIWSVISR